MHKHNFGHTLKNQSAVATLNIYYLSVSKQFIYASLVEKTPLVQKRPILQLFKDGDLEMR